MERGQQREADAAGEDRPTRRQRLKDVGDDNHGGDDALEVIELDENGYLVEDDADGSDEVGDDDGEEEAGEHGGGDGAANARVYVPASCYRCGSGPIPTSR
jgi:hypothetical protein